MKPVSSFDSGAADWLLLLLLLAFFFFASCLPIDNHIQALLSIAVISILVLVSRCLPKKGLPRIFFITICTFMVLRYFHWRLFFTLSFDNFPSFVCSLLLFGAELYGIMTFLLSVFVNLRPVGRAPARMPLDSDKLPTVDVLVPSYDEDEDLLAITLLGALSIRYPAEKLNVYLLDDGGTVAKRNQTDPIKARLALKRHLSLQELCLRLGVNYLTREENIQAKAGNMNAALPRTHGELILILDADHVPTVDFLEKTVGYFLDDERLFLVQTPHFFVNPDPIEKNLGLFQSMPSENLMFYGAIHPGLDFWNASFFCGSAALLRRAALAETNGFSGKSITEDAETALSLHARGWNSCYLRYPLISGLQPETFSSFMVQRMRWAQGMVQLFILNSPLRLKGLTIPQRLCYLSNMSFWFFPIARIIFALTPLAFLLFGLHIYNATILEIGVYAVPYLIVLLMFSDYLFGRVRWNFISQVYEVMQSMYSFRAVIEVMRNPRSPSFGVTPKSEKLGEDFISPLVKPFYWMIAATTFSLLVGVWRFFDVPMERPLIAVALFWAFFNFILYAASLGAMLERRQRRTNPRLPADFKTTIQSGGSDDFALEVHVKDISVGGASIISPISLGQNVRERSDLFIIGTNAVLGKPYRLGVQVRNSWQHGRDHIYGISFNRENLEQFRDIVLLVHCDSQRWEKVMTNCAPDPGFVRGMAFLAKSGIVHIGKYMMIFMAGMLLRHVPQVNRVPKIRKFIKSVSL